MCDYLYKPSVKYTVTCNDIIIYKLRKNCENALHNNNVNGIFKGCSKTFVFFLYIRIDNVAPIAYKNSILFLPEWYEMSLSCFFFRCYIMHYNASLFVSQDIIPRSGLSATNTRYSQ